MKVFQIIRESFEELPDEPHNSKIVMKERMKKYIDKIADLNRQNLIFKIEPDFDVNDEDILPGEHYALATSNPVTRAKITDVFNRLEAAKEKFRNYKMDNPVDQYAHIEDVIGLKGGWYTMGETEEKLLRQKLAALIKKKLVLPRAQVPKTKRDKMYDAGQLDDKDITSYFVPPGPNQAKIIKYVIWWKGAKKKLDDELKELRKQRESQRGKAERYKANQAKAGDIGPAKGNAKLLLAYALKNGKVSTEDEEVLAQESKYAIPYAVSVLKGRFPAFEIANKNQPNALITYLIALNKRVPSVEADIKTEIRRWPNCILPNGWLHTPYELYKKHFGVDLAK